VSIKPTIEFFVPEKCFSGNFIEKAVPETSS